MSSISKRLRDLRDRTGWTQAVLARRLGKTRNYITLLETGERTNPSSEFLWRLEMVERGEEVISAIQVPSKSSEKKGDQTDLEWLISHGYGENLANIAKELRLAVEKNK
jgi:transcriptional regulator with XRE-family HTH domain